MDDLALCKPVPVLCEEHADRLRSFVRGLLPDRDEAEDVLHEIFLIAHQRADDFRPGSDFLAWTRAIARNKVLEHCRRISREPVVSDPEVLELLAASAAEADETFEQRRGALAECLKRLAPRAGQLVTLRYAEDLSLEEVARRMGWSEGAAKVALSRARSFLRACARRILERA